MLRLILRFAQAGLIHGDFNEFNLMLTEDEKLIVIDFPQVVSIEHPSAEMYFERDVECVRDYLRRKFGVELETNLTYAKALEAFRKNAPAESAPEGGYAMPAKPQKVVVALAAEDEKVLAAALDAARGDADRTADFEDEEDSAGAEDSDEEEETDAGGDDDAAARDGLAFRPPPRAESASQPQPDEAGAPSAPRDAQFVAVGVA